MKEKIFGDIETLMLFLGIIGVTALIASAFNFFLNRYLKSNTACMWSPARKAHHSTSRARSSPRYSAWPKVQSY